MAATKITDTQAILDAYSRGVSQSAIAREHGVTQGRISQIVRAAGLRRSSVNAPAPEPAPEPSEIAPADPRRNRTWSERILELDLFAGERYRERRQGQLAAVLHHLERGLPQTAACALAQCPRATWSGMQTDERIAELRDEAIARWHAKQAELIDGHAQRDWRAASWRLERHAQTRADYRAAEYDTAHKTVISVTIGFAQNPEQNQGVTIEHELDPDALIGKRIASD